MVSKATSSGGVQPKGFATLISILILSVVCLSLTLSIILSGLNSSETTYKFLQMQQARALAVACGEEALEQIRADKLYVGSGGLTLGEGTCSYTVNAYGSETRIIHSYGVVGSVVRRIEIYISAINPNIIIQKMRDVADFCTGQGCSETIIVTGSGSTMTGSGSSMNP